MKANEVTEKLYFTECDKIVLDIYSTKETDDVIEYTRTDVIIEKACAWLSNMPLEDMEYKYDSFDTSEGWYKMIEDFKKYMEK